MDLTTTTIDTITCPDCGGDLVLDTIGSITFSHGEVLDTLHDRLICTGCGHEVEDTQADEIPF